MKPSEAAAQIGCSVPHIRLLIRRKLLKAKRIRGRYPTGTPFYEWDIPAAEIKRYQIIPQTFGRPRGAKNKLRFKSTRPANLKLTDKFLTNNVDTELKEKERHNAKAKSKRKASRRRAS